VPNEHSIAPKSPRCHGAFDFEKSASYSDSSELSFSQREIAPNVTANIGKLTLSRMLARSCVR
jgi:hypothetical protein